jgi:hypothetical protein
MKDVRGVEVTPGDIVAYVKGTYRVGNTLNVGVVDKLNRKTFRVLSLVDAKRNDSNAPTKLIKPEKLVLLFKREPYDTLDLDFWNGYAGVIPEGF